MKNSILVALAICLLSMSSFVFAAGKCPNTWAKCAVIFHDYSSGEKKIRKFDDLFQTFHLMQEKKIECDTTGVQTYSCKATNETEWKNVCNALIDKEKKATEIIVYQKLERGDCRYKI